MTKSITPGKIKQTNRELIYRYIYKKRKTSQQDISYTLHLSRPTVTSKLAELEEEGLIRRAGQFDSEFVGRKAVAYTVTEDYRVSVGVEILRREVKIIVMNLYGEKIGREVLPLAFRQDESYYRSVCNEILAFLAQLGIPTEKVLGMGIAVQGLVSPDGRTITYGKILQCTGLTIDAFASGLPFPCQFVHDANGAANSELWLSPDLQDMVYFSLSRHLGAAMVCGRRILTGQHGHTATVEHMMMRKDGDPCYCGRRGCMETLCSLKALLGDEPIESFFDRLERGSGSDVDKRWQTYLDHLAEAINMLHLLYDSVFVLGGYLAPYLTQEDIDGIYDRIDAMTPFDEPRDFIRISLMPKHNIAIGAALPYLEAFLKRI